MEKEIRASEVRIRAALATFFLGYQHVRAGCARGRYAIVSNWGAACRQPESPNEGAVLRIVMNRDRQKGGRLMINRDAINPVSQMTERS